MRTAALALCVLAAVVSVAGVMAPGHAASHAASSDEEPDICLRLDAAALQPGDWPALVAAVDSVMAARPTLIPDRSVVAVPDPAMASPSPAEGDWRIGLWSTGGSDRGSRAQREASLAGVDCGATEPPWAASVAGTFLRTGTQRELAAAPTTPGFESSIDVEWFPGEQRVRTVLRFSGPLGIPNGTCWMDDLLGVDGPGRAIAEVETGFTTSPFGEGVCGRFEDFLPQGGAGAQAITLLPIQVALADGTSLRFRVSTLEVTAAGIELSGSIEPR